MDMPFGIQILAKEEKKCIWPSALFGQQIIPRECDCLYQ